MFHNPFQSTSRAIDWESRMSGARSSNKGTQTYSMKSRGTQTSSRFRGTNKKTQTPGCFEKPKKAYNSAGTQTGPLGPVPTKPRFPLSMYGHERRFPEFKGSATESSEKTDVDLYAFAGGYCPSQIQSLDSAPGGSRASGTEHGCDSGGHDEICACSDSSYIAVFSSPSE